MKNHRNGKLILFSEVSEVWAGVKQVAKVGRWGRVVVSEGDVVANGGQ